MDKIYVITFADGFKRTMGIHNTKTSKNELSLADILIRIVDEGTYSLDDIVMIQLIKEEDLPSHYIKVIFKGAFNDYYRV